MDLVRRLLATGFVVGALHFALPASTSVAGELPSGWPSEEVYTQTLPDEVRISVNSPGPDDPSASTTRLLLYALPNGNTIEQTLGCRMKPGLDWHYDIQHVAAQVRLLRQLNPAERLVLVCAEAGGLSWPSWRGSRSDGNARIGRYVQQWRERFGDAEAKVTLAAHSGGGSFIFGLIEDADSIPACIDRIALLDANYSFDAAKHADKLVRWLRGDETRRLVVIAYDDREIMLQGKKVVGPDGGTFRATRRMVDAFKPQFAVEESTFGPFTEYSALGGRVRFYVHPNPENKILHTALVGEMNGLVHAQTLGTAAEGAWGVFGGPRAYEKWIQPEPTTTPSTDSGAEPATGEPAPGIPARPTGAKGGREFFRQLAAVTRQEREAAILAEVTRGNIPDFLRKFVPVAIHGGDLQGTIEVMPDYLAVGSDDDFVRVPLTPQTGQAIADRFGCTLPTRKIVDAIDAAAEVRLAPQPLTEDRESVAAFLLSNDQIERQRQGRPLGALTRGAKKDVVLSPRMFERPDRVVIYGWRQLDDRPIQPLTNVHVEWYVDYSHGVRLVRDEMLLDGDRASIPEVLVDPARCAILSDEGPIVPPRYQGD